jgi:hypothetical protein
MITNVHGASRRIGRVGHRDTMVPVMTAPSMATLINRAAVAGLPHLQ